MIAISPGHHPKARGACYNNVCEFPLSLMWVDQIIIYLKEYGIECTQVPATKLGAKVKFINRSNALLAAEIHFNSDPARAGKGAEVLYYPGSKKGKDAAHEVQDALATTFKDRGVKEGYYRMDPKNKPDYFLSKTRCTSIIIEPEFIHNFSTLEHKLMPVCDLIAQALIRVYRNLKEIKP